MNRNGLARRLIVLTVLASSSIALVITAIQLYLEYRRDISQVSATFQQIESGYLDSVIGNVWLADRGRLKILLGGIRSLPDFAFAEVRVDGVAFATAGTRPEGQPMAREWVLTHELRGRQVEIGRLEVAADMDRIVARTLNRVWFILGANAIKTTLVALIIFLAVRRLVTEPVRQMAEATKRISAGDLETPLAPPTRSDEIGDLARSIDGMRAGLSETHGQLSRLNVELEESLRARSDALVRSIASERQLAVSRSHLETAQQLAQLGSWEWDGRHFTASEELRRLLGVAATEPLLYADLTDRTAPADQRRVAKALDGAVSGHGGFHLDHGIIRPDGTIRQVVHHADTLREGDQGFRVLGVVQDITERKRTLDQLELASLVFANTQEGIIITDERTTILSVNKAFTEITGYTPDEAIGNTPRLLRSDRQPNHFYADMWHALNEIGIWQGEIWNRRKNGEAYLQWENIFSVTDEDGEIRRYIAVFSDVTEMHHKDQRIHHQANHDSLTGLPNRTLLFDRLARVLDEGDPVAILILNLDRVRMVNESLGPEPGDRLLQAAGAGLVACARRTDTVARLSGDEFAVILQDQTDASQIAHMVEKIMARLHEPITLDGHTVQVTASVGIAVYPEDGTAPDLLLKHATTAMTRAKAQGRNTYRFFDSSMNSRAIERLDLEARLRRATDNGDFELHYQPKVCLSSGTVCGSEALIRWRLPDQGLVSPAEFIPLAEETGLILPIGQWALAESCRQLAQWRREGLAMPQVAVNLSARQFQSPRLTDDVGRQLARFDLQPEMLELELTESTMMGDPEGAAAILARLGEMGLSVAVDDFGTGYSSLGYLKKLPLHALKIDRSFVIDIGSDRRDEAMIEAVVAMAKALSLKVVAEGVEHQAQADFLARIGCHMIQGFLFARPMPAAELGRWLKVRPPAAPIAPPGFFPHTAGPTI
jgi:diguanylate cyclase (GGDEF)-like protein/PAS domain S-box-containing protein